GNYEVIMCDECGFIHINPIPTVEELEKVYKEEYYTTEKPQFIEKHLEDIDWWNVVYDDRYDFFEQNLPKDRRKILDIGCGPGFFLKRGKDRGWDCLGVEPSKVAAEYASMLGVKVLNIFLEDTDFEKKKERFDVIYLSEVLEHIPDPTALCRAVYSLLDNGGIVCAVVPNDYSPIQKVLRKKLNFKPYWLAPPYHINYFSAESFEGLLSNVGFRVIERVAMFPIDFFLLMGDDYVGNDDLGRICHTKRKRLDIMLNEPELNEFKHEMYALMARHNIGREMIIYGKREC
ncbi:MAG: methyltransferase domain-containing protein, partial [Candidatus Anammoxibacter sp.]